MVKKSRDLMGEFSPNLSHPFSNFGASRSFGKSDVKFLLQFQFQFLQMAFWNILGAS